MQHEKTFPLFTNKALAERWGVSKQMVRNWANRHSNFCDPVKGIVNGDGPYYPLYEVERYERERKEGGNPIGN